MADQTKKCNIDIYKNESPMATAKMSAVIKFGAGDTQTHVLPPLPIVRPIVSDRINDLDEEK